MSTQFPFTAVVGQDDARLALTLCAVDRGVGGVLLRGQKGSAKSTLARGLAALLPGGAPFVELPVGATEDRVVGTIDFEAALVEGRRRVQLGLLADADGGVLYVDEVNLLPDHLVDVLLDVAAGGVNRIQREGIAHEHPSRFILIGSMNPEEGDLRPQLLDRFGLAVDVRAPTAPAARAEAVRRRLAFDADPARFAAAWADGEAGAARRIAGAQPALVDDDLLHTISGLCASVGAEGLRADLVIARAAAALAGWEGRAQATVDDVRRVAPFALAHRRRRTPFEEPGIEPEEIDEALRPPETDEADDAVPEPDEPASVMPLRTASRGGSGRRSPTQGTRGRLLGARPPDGPVASLAVGATARAAAVRQATTPTEQLVVPADLREAMREHKVGNLIVVAVDASASMGAPRRMEAVKGAVVGLLLDAYQRRDRVALVTFRGTDAEVVLRPTSSVEVARARLADLPVGGTTPLAAGLQAALDLATSAGGELTPLLVIVSDGRATAGPDGADPLAAAHEVAARIRRRGVAAVVVDAEDGHGRLGLAAELAATMGAPHITLADFTAGALADFVRSETSQ